MAYADRFARVPVLNIWRSWVALQFQEDTLKQRVNKGRQTRARKENQQCKAEKQNDDGHQPPFFVRFDKVPEVSEKTSAGLRVRCFFKRAA